MKSVLFVDPPAFQTTIEELDDPRLRSRPVAISPLAADRALILAVSPEARAAGVERGMAATLARKVCPDLIVRPPNPRRCAAADQALQRILARVAPVIEPRGWGHAYLDLTGTERLLGSATAVAHRLERETRAELRLPLAVGVATNKLVSEVAAAVIKRHAAEVHSVPPGTEADFLAPEPVVVLPTLSDRMRIRLDEYQLVWIGEVAAVGERPLRQVFGLAGRTLHQHTCGIDHRPVLPPAVQAACRVAVVLATDTNDRAALRAVLRTLNDRLGARLRQRQLAAGALTLLVRYSDDVVARRTQRVAYGTLDADLWRAAGALLDLLLTRRLTIRSLALLAADLRDPGGQCELWPDLAVRMRPTAVALQQVRDAIRSPARRS